MAEDILVSTNDDSGSEQNQVTLETNQVVNKPGKRLQNPLGAFSSYTYQLSLYMITPQAYDAFIASGRTQINSLVGPSQNLYEGAYLIAQSGGINDKTSFRASTNELDYYIDNLSIKTFLSGKATLTASVDTEIKFQITEPYGFSFLSDLNRVANLIYGDSTDVKRPKAATRGFFILGVSFVGYDENGNIVNTRNPNLEIAPESDLSRIQDRYFDIMITDIKFKIAGGPSIYDITAVAIAPKVSFSVTKGMLKTGVQVYGPTVEEGVNQIIEKLNFEQDSAAQSQGVNLPRLNRYSVRWVGPDVERLKSSKIESLREIYEWNNKAKLSFNSEVTNTNTVTEVANTRPANLDVGIVQIKNDTPITQALTQIIGQSSYLTDALSVIYASQNEPDTETGQYSSELNSSKETIKWYTLGSEVKNAQWIPEISDFIYDIVYIIQPYETPAVQTPYGVSADMYYGPYKRYDYWYTGKNSEIISYEQRIDQGYYTIFLDVTGKGNVTEVPVDVNSRNDQSRLNNLTVGAEAQNSILTNLYDPASFATAQITILGDPDYLMPDSPVSEQALYDQFYAPDGFTINPHGGQTFIEINFLEARDYDTEKGYLTINDKIIFWKYPEENQSQSSKIEGISYMIIDVTSTFRGGTFRQTLNCVINPLSLVSNNTITNPRNDTNNEVDRQPVTGLPSEPAPPSPTNRPVPASGDLIQDIQENTPSTNAEQRFFYPET